MRVDFCRAPVCFFTQTPVGKAANNSGRSCCAEIIDPRGKFLRKLTVASRRGDYTLKSQHRGFAANVSCDYLFRIIDSTGRKVCQEQLLRNPKMWVKL